MKKYILTESQVQSIINMVLNEQIILEQREEILKMKDLVGLILRLVPDSDRLDYDTLMKLFQNTYKFHGSQGVSELFNLATKLNLEDMGHNRYMIK